MAGYEQEGAQRGGHIPGAASVPWAQAVTEDGTFKSADELRELYGGKGVLERRRRSSPTAASASARRTPGSCCTSCSARATSRTTTARGPSGATSSTCRSRRAPSPAALEQVGEDPRRRAPDRGARRPRRCRSGTGRRGAAGAGAVAGAQLAERRARAPSSTSRRRQRPRVAGLDQPDEGVDRVARGDRRRRLQRADAARPRSGGRPISSCGLAQRGVAQVLVVGSWRPPGNEISPAWRRRSSRRRVRTTWSSASPSRNSGTSTAASCGRGRRAPRPASGRAGPAAGAARRRTLVSGGRARRAR